MLIHQAWSNLLILNQSQKIAPCLLDQHVARLLLEAAKYTQSTWKNGFLVILCRGGGRHNALGSYDMTLPRSSGHWLFEDVESSLLRSFKLTRYLATLQNSVAATLITASGDAWLGKRAGAAWLDGSTCAYSPGGDLSNCYRMFAIEHHLFPDWGSMSCDSRWRR